MGLPFPLFAFDEYFVAISWRERRADFRARTIPHERTLASEQARVCFQTS
jgi:hypothetical protein